MSFRRRIGLLAGAAVAVAIALASVLAYVTIRAELRGQVDESLRDRAYQFVSRGLGPFGGPGPGRFPRPPRARGGFDFYEQLVIAGRGTLGDAALPVARELPAEPAYRDVEVDGQDVRMLTFPIADGLGAIQIGRSLGEVNTILRTIRWILLAVALGGVALAAVLGRLVAGRAVEPLRRLTETAEHVADTQDLGRRIDHDGSEQDEIGRLAARFNEMLDALQVSMASQRQLIADASHELRTPVTSLRTNLEILQANPELDPDRRATLLARATQQTEELTGLMNDLIDLARGDQREEGMEPLRLDELVDEAVERAARHAPGVAFDVQLEETTVVGSPGRLAKAVNNLLDNAVKWNEPGRPIEVALHDGELRVRDHGPGFAADELAHVFDRFFRGAHARDRSGSGLGLAIVRQVAESHRGSVTAGNAPDGGAELVLTLPAQAHVRVPR